MRLTERFQKFNDSQRHSLDSGRNLAVRANAGSGKTSVLIERIVQLLAKSWDEGQPLRLTALVAVTYTRKAACELQDRLRSSFRPMAENTSDPRAQAYWTGLIDELPHAMIGTIDSFCGRILREFGMLDESPDRIEPDFEPLEEYDEAVLKREAIDRVINRLSSMTPAAAGSEERAQVEACQWWATTQGYDVLTRYLTALLNHTVEPAVIVAAHRALPPVAERVEEQWGGIRAVRLLRQGRDTVRAELQDFVDAIDRLEEQKKTLAKVREQLLEILDVLQLGGIAHEQTTLLLLRDMLLTKEGKGRSRRNLGAAALPFIMLQETWVPLLKRFSFDHEAECAAQEAADRLVRLLQSVHAEYLQLCRAANRFDFTTIARRARDLLRTSPGVRSELKARYRYLMVDEFQDTNPLQWEIISWLAGAGPEAALERDRLFVVGDPQQSIYRFRHADVSVFHQAQERICSSNEAQGSTGQPTDYDRHRQRELGSANSTEGQRLGLMPLAENYRSLTPVPLELLNHVFRHVFDPLAHDLDLEHDKFEIEYQDLAPGIAVKAVGEVRYVVPPGASEEAPNDQEGDDEGREEPAQSEEALGHVQVQAVVDQLVSLYGQPRHTAQEGEGRQLVWRDMAVLLPSRDVVLTELEKELRRRGVPFVVSKGIGFWQRQEVRDVVSLTSCLADSGDDLALFAVLRSPLGQLTDTEILFLSQLGFGSFGRGLRLITRVGEVLSEPSCADEDDRQWVKEHWQRLPQPVQSALETLWQSFSNQVRDRLRRTALQLARWRERGDRMAHADLLQRCLEESGAYAIYAAETEGEVILGNLIRLFDAIRSEEFTQAPGLAALARRLRRQVDESPKEEQATVDAGQDAVQIMTVHAAKGLEFPVVAVMKMERENSRASGAGLMVLSETDALLRGDAAEFPPVRPGTVAVRLRHPRRPRELYRPRLLTALRNLDRAQQLAESRRLFYVAATRAKERLILAGKEGVRARQSWQRWFEEALGLTDEHKQKKLWEDPERNFKVTIVTETTKVLPPEPKQVEEPVEVFDLEYIHEQPLSPTIATTGLAEMQKTWREDRRAWWLRYQVKVQPHVPLPALGPERGSSDSPQIGTTVGTLVHRLFEMGDAVLRQPQEKLRELLEAMAINLLSSATENPEEDDAALGVGSDVTTIVDAVEQILRRLASDKAGTKKIRDLLTAASEVEVDFGLRLGRWHISGRFDKLLATPAGFEIVDWKTDQEGSPAEIAQRHLPQMRLYALALYRSGQAAVVQGSVRVHLALLHPMRVQPLLFSTAALEAFARELMSELEAMQTYQPREYPDDLRG